MRLMIISTLLILICSFGLSKELPSDKTYTIAFAQDTLGNDFRFTQVKVVEEILKKYPNINFIYSDAKSNTALQIKQIEDFIYQKIDILMTSPYDEIATGSVISKAYESGIPVILVGRSVKNGKYTTFIHPDNEKIAFEAAKYIIEKMSYKGRILLLTGVPNADSSRKRIEGFYKAAKEYPKIEVIERRANYLRRDAILVVDKLLNSGKSFDAIMAHSDSMLVGARMALKTHGVDPSTLTTVGIDYIKEAQKAIRAGQQTSSFVYSLCAKESAEIALKILNGERVPKEIKLETLQVTKDNVDEVKPIF